MKKSEQTEEVKVKLYQLTDQFTKKLVHRYYKQYTGSIEDLVMEYYLDFLTPKSREKGKEESLLDKYDDKVTSLPYLVKVAVARKLIDSSRQNPISLLRIDNYVEDYGDCITAAFDLAVEPEDGVDDKMFSLKEAQNLKLRFESYTDESKEMFYKQYQDVKCALTKVYQDLFDFIFSGYEQDREVVEDEQSVNMLLSVEGIGDCDVQQVTDKTACVYIESVGLVVDFNRVTGEARGKTYKGFSLTKAAVEYLKTVEKWHSGVSRIDFEENHKHFLV